jgi:hypothetical protein
MNSPEMQATHASGVCVGYFGADARLSQEQIERALDVVVQGVSR